MSDEQRARELLRRAAQLPDEILPPVQQLIRAGRRRRRLRSAQRTLAVGVVAALAVVIPQAIHAINAGPASNRPGRPVTRPPVMPSGPTGAQMAKFRWSKLPPSPLGPRQQAILTPAGRYLIELGGMRDGNSVNDGAALDLLTSRWHKIAAVDGNVGFDQAVTVWTGRYLFVTNGQEESCLAGKPVAPCLPDAGLYDPVTNRWTLTQLPRVMEGLDPVSVTWTGRVVVLAGLDAHHGRLAVAAYDPATGRWQVITPRLPVGHPPTWVYLTEAGGRVILWSGWLGSNPHADVAGVDVLAFNDAGPNPVGAWRTVTVNWPQAQTFSAAIFTGRSLLITPGSQWCSICATDYHIYRAYFVNPVTLGRTATVPYDTVGSSGPDYIWAGRTVIGIHFGRGNPVPYLLRHLGDYDPGTGKWRALPPAPGRAQPDVLPVWTGRELVVVTEQGTTLALHR
jgi:hypothetical protein